MARERPRRTDLAPIRAAWLGGEGPPAAAPAPSPATRDQLLHAAGTLLLDSQLEALAYGLGAPRGTLRTNGTQLQMALDLLQWVDSQPDAVRADLETRLRDLAPKAF